MLSTAPVASVIIGGCSIIASAGSVRADLSFAVSFDPSVRSAPASGRLVVYMIKDGALVEGDDPADGPFFENPQPMFGVDVHNVAPGAEIDVGAAAAGFPTTMEKLQPGVYRVQAVLDMKHENSSWRREVGNLSSKVVTITVDASPARNHIVRLPLSETVTPADLAPAPREGVEFMQVRSELLSKFRGREVMLNAGIVLPADYDAARSYAAVYEVPGFGGDHTQVRDGLMLHHAPADSPAAQLARNVFWIVLDPEGPNGHTLFADSANNGPVADALITELIPAIEKKYKLAAEPAARLLRGHSSGGWATLWLATHYPHVFGATWSSSPDPVDFRRFQLIDIYGPGNAYLRPSDLMVVDQRPMLERTDRLLPSYRDGRGAVRMTIAQENAMEEILGPDNTSAQQWDSWFAVFGPRPGKVGGAAGAQAAADAAAVGGAALWDAATGVLDHTIAEQYREFDIADPLRRNPAKYGPIFKQRVRLLVGDSDNYYLNEAVALLKADVDKLNFIDLPEGSHGYIKIVPGKDHSSLFATPEMAALPGQMLEHLRRADLVSK